MTQWQPIDTFPNDQRDHVRALIVRSASKGSQWWEIIAGYVNDDGDFVDHSGNAPWRADDYTHWAPLPPMPQEPQP